MVQHADIDHSGITGVPSTISFGSNSNSVSSFNGPGSSSCNTRADHVHLGVTSVSHTSNTFSGPVTLVAGANIGITSPTSGTLTFSGAAAGGSAATSAVTYDHLTADETKTDATLVDTGLSFAVVSGSYYRFRFDLIYRSTVTTVGIKLGLTTPTFTDFTAWVRINVVTTASATGVYDGSIQASGGSVVAANVTATGTDYPAVVEGVIVPSASGTLMLQFAAETTGATVTLRKGSAGELVLLD